MKKIFRSKPFVRSRSEDKPHDSKGLDRRLSLPDEYPFEIIHSSSSSSSNLDNPNFQINRNVANDETSISPTNTSGLPNNNIDNDDESVALSDTETLLIDRNHRLVLQETYNENFTHYLPFLMRRMRLDAQQRENANPANHSDPDINEYDESSLAAYDDDQSTIFNEAMNDSDLLSDHNNLMQGNTHYPVPTRIRILDKPTTRFSIKREFIIANEFIKNNYLVFTDQNSFKLFKELRSNIKKRRKSSIIMYDTQGNIKRLTTANDKDRNLSQQNRASADSGSTFNGNLIDNRPHIVPLEFKVKGEALPLFKISTPYLSAFRKNTPFMVFKRYREVPLKPTGDISSLEENGESDNFETYVFCTVHVKYFQTVKRYTLKFTPLDEPPFTMLLFQHNFRPFTDFNYQNTRFRIVGTSLQSVYMLTYNPNLKLFVIDPDQASLMDNVINKNSGSEFGSLIKRKSTSQSTGKSNKNSSTSKSRSNSFSETNKSLPVSSQSSNSPASISPDHTQNNDDPSQLSNPIPNPNNPLLSETFHGYHGVSDSQQKYVPNNCPPFSNFNDARTYISRQPLLPKKYAEVGKIDLYQDIENFELRDRPLSSTLSVDQDSLVLSTVILVLMENNVRSSSRSANNGAVTRMGTFGPMLPPMGSLMIGGGAY